MSRGWTGRGLAEDAECVPLPFVSACCPPQMAAHASWTVDRFIRLQKIGEGFASHVFLSIDTLGRMRVALKIYQKKNLTPALLAAVRHEVSVHGRCVHPHVLPLLAAFEDGGYLCIVTCIAENSDLHRRLPDIRRDEPTVVKHILGPLLSALAALHIAGYIHRDIKPENIMLQGSHALLADFGFAICHRRRRAVTRLGTLQFMAPEVVLNDPDDKATHRAAVPRDVRLPYSDAVDVWALGVVAYECLTGTLPFPGTTDDEVVEAVLRRRPQYPGTLSRDAVEFLELCLAYDPGKRGSAVDLYYHPFVRKHMPRDHWHRLEPSHWASPEAAAAAMAAFPALVPSMYQAPPPGTADDGAGPDSPTPSAIRRACGSFARPNHEPDAVSLGDQRGRFRAQHSQVQSSAPCPSPSVAGSAANSLPMGNAPMPWGPLTRDWSDPANAPLGHGHGHGHGRAAPSRMRAGDPNVALRARAVQGSFAQAAVATVHKSALSSPALASARVRSPPRPPQVAPQAGSSTTGPSPSGRNSVTLGIGLWHSLYRVRPAPAGVLHGTASGEGGASERTTQPGDAVCGRGGSVGRPLRLADAGPSTVEGGVVETVESGEVLRAKSFKAARAAGGSRGARGKGFFQRVFGCLG